MAHKEEVSPRILDQVQKTQLILYDESAGKFYFAPFAEFLKLANLDVALSTRALETGGNLASLAAKDFATQTTLASVLGQLNITLSALRDAICAADVDATNLKNIKDAIDLLETTSAEITKWGGTLLTGRDISLDLANLVNLDTTLSSRLKPADLNLDVDKDVQADVKTSALPTGASTEATLGGVKTGTDKIPTDPAKESGKLTDIAGRLAFLEFDDNYFKPDWGDDNADGVIYSPEATSGAIDTYSDVWSKIFPPSEIAGTLEKMARGMTAEFIELNTTTTLTWQWQIRPKDGSWIDLHTAVTEAANTITAYTPRTRQGEKILTGLTTTPFEIKLRFKTSEAN